MNRAASALPRIENHAEELIALFLLLPRIFFLSKKILTTSMMCTPISNTHLHSTTFSPNV